MITVQGKERISAKIVQDSINSREERITTFELDYPRFVHSELMTHRMFSRNAASSRAVPVEKMHDAIRDNPAMPVFWGKNQAGMQAKEELSGEALEKVKGLWNAARDIDIDLSRQLFVLGLHKQLANRRTEADQMMRTIVTATEWDNWFTLRDHPDAQPEIAELAKCMREALQQSKPMLIHYEEWHVPYVYRGRNDVGIVYSDGNGNTLSEVDAKMVSASCCAQVSYRKNDDTLEKAKNIFERLIYSDPQHASPVEHQATPIHDFTYPEWPAGVTHIDRKGKMWSGNFYGWVQFRQLL